MTQTTKQDSDAGTTASPEELSWSVDGLTLSGLAWGPADGHRVLALHGWLDNALSFQELARHLPDCRIVSLDLTGHGLSDDRSPDATYQIWDDIPQVIGVLDELGWERCTLLAHSRGASIAAILAGSVPERFERLIALDWFLPRPTDESDAAKQFRNFLTDRERRMKRPPRIFNSIEEYVQRRIQTGTEPNSARQLAARALVARDGGYELRGDGRLFGASALKLSSGQVDAFLAALKMPVILFRFETGHGRNDWVVDLTERAGRLVDDFTVTTIEGHHHCHMEPAQAAQIATQINRFMAAGKTGGGLMQ